MPIVTLRISEDLYNQVKATAEYDRRSINSELLWLIERSLLRSGPTVNTLTGPPHPAALKLMREQHPELFQAETWQFAWSKAWALLTPHDMRTLIEDSDVDPEDHDYQGDGTSRCCVCLGQMNDHVPGQSG
jgi:hypothetical protein